MSTKRIITIGIILLLVAVVTFRLISNKKEIDSKKQATTTTLDRSIPVNIYVLQEQIADKPLEKIGTLLPNKEADINSISGGKLVKVNFDLGQYVQQGSTLAQIDNQTLELHLQAAQLAKEKAEKDYQRFKTLFEGEAATEMNYRDAQLNAQNAANQVEQIKKQMADNTIKAPIGGQIVLKLKEAGEFVGPGSVLGHIIDISRLKANVLIGEQDVYDIKIGQKVSVRTDIYPNSTFEGTVSFISNQGDATHNYPVEVSLQNPKDKPLKAGTFVYVNFNRMSHQPILMIPRSALVSSVQNPQVYVVKQQKAELRTINLGNEYGNNIEVTSGLAAGDTIVVSGQLNLSNGAGVKAIPTKTSQQ